MRSAFSLLVQILIPNSGFSPPSRTSTESITSTLAPVVVAIPEGATEEET